MLELKNKNIDSNSNTKNKHLYSFDVFDTLITRKTPTPQGIFAIMQEILLKDSEYFNIPLYIRENFYNYRIKSEQYQYSYNDCVNNYIDCSFDEIYQNFADNFSLEENQVKLLKKLELEVEYENLIPINKNITKLKKLVEDGERVVLISDMYQSADTIRHWLSKFDSVFTDITIYVSNEYKKKKNGGELYKYVQDIEGVDYKNWQHYGDNIKSDFENANSLGINAKKYEYPKLTKYESFLLNSNRLNTTNILSIGCSKNLRINEEKTSKYIIGLSLTAPILVPYVLWLLQESLNKGFKTLYFIARDGYFIKEIADFIIKKRNIDIKTKYIYGSRLAWQGASFCASIENLNDVIMQYGVNPEFLSKILDIEQDKLENFLQKENLKMRKNLSLHEREDLVISLKNNKEFLALIREKNQLKYENLIGYLKQEIDFLDKNYAFVDLTGSGVTQNCLASIINTFYNKSINSFYLRNGQYKVEPRNVNRFYYVLRNDACAMLEILARAPHGQTIGYKYDLNTEKYIPIFDDNEELINNWNYDSYHNGIIDYTREYLKLSAYKYFNPISSSISNIYIDWLINKIDNETANELGSIIYSHAGKNETNEFAPKIKRRYAILKCFGIDKIKTNNYKLSFSRSKSSTKNILKFCQKYKNIWQWLLYIHVNKKKNIALIRILGIDITFKKLLGMEG